MYSRLNYLRLLLAWAVMAFHLHVLQFPLAGPLAVWCFFVISGFLVSKILYEKYRHRPGDFIRNRFLRIFPTYWVALAIGVLLGVLQPDGIANFSSMPVRYQEWLRNIVIFGLDSPPRVVGPAWSLAIELNWYLIFFIGSFLPRKWLLVFLAANLVLPLVIVFLFDDTVYKLGAGFAFSLGALAYHSDFRVPKTVQIAAALLVPVMLFVMPIYCGVSAFAMKSPGANASMLGVAVMLFAALPWFAGGDKSGRLSNLAGELSYPIFVLHPFAGWLAARWLENPGYGWPLLCVATLICLMMSIVVVWLVERPIAMVRSRIRDRSPRSKQIPAATSPLP